MELLSNRLIFTSLNEHDQRHINVEEFKETLTSSNVLIQDAPGDNVFLYNGDNDVVLVVNQKEGNIITVYRVDEIE